MDNALSTWLAHEAATFVLECTRIGGVIIAAPFAWSFLPARAKVALVLLLAYFAHGPLRAADLREAHVFELGLAIVSELFLGLSLGMIARLVVMIAEVAADTIAPMMGLGAAQMFDPSLGGQGTVLTRLLRYFGVLIALLTGLHHLLIQAVLRSFVLVPAGAIQNPYHWAQGTVGLLSEGLILGIQLALPFVVILFIAQISLAFVARAAPAMQIFSIGFAVTLGTGAFLWIFFAADVVAAFVELRPWMIRHLDELLLAIAGGPP